MPAISSQMLEELEAGLTAVIGVIRNLRAFAYSSPEVEQQIAWIQNEVSSLEGRITELGVALTRIQTAADSLSRNVRHEAATFTANLGQQQKRLRELAKKVEAEAASWRKNKRRA